jgi:hypothetical protein
MFMLPLDAATATPHLLWLENKASQDGDSLTSSAVNILPVSTCMCGLCCGLDVCAATTELFY